MSLTLTVEARVLGQRKPLVSDWEVSLPPQASQGLTLRELIECVVREEVAAFNSRQEARRFTQVLTPDQIQEGVARGKVDMGGREEVLSPADTEAAVTTAIQAFEDGLYFVFVDEVQQTELNRAIPLQSASRALFLRLVALAGG